MWAKLAARKPVWPSCSLSSGRGLVFDFIGDVGRTHRNEEIVVAMAVHERGVVGGDLHFENANEFVFEGEMMMGFIGDFNFGSGLGARNA